MKIWALIIMLHISSYQLHIMLRIHISSISNQVNSYFLKDYTGIYQNWKQLSSKQKAMAVEIIINKAKEKFKKSDIKTIETLLKLKDIDIKELMAIINEVISNFEK